MPAWRNISLWMDQLDEPLLARPSLEQDLDVDVAIIGAGYTGLWTAYYLKRLAPTLNICSGQLITDTSIGGFDAIARS
ncbi:O-acetylhomoserine sulfhydrylase [Pseudomonas chlororaphis]|uniref:O-acetylhomoserine sulfhydrylase n=1 Tax=Pseudomonas chlororaphis TaxID=587753 RepID=A0A3G7TS99_9PSED|nr:O-acetylhomoserine sulfhydrylase [Pseudomonas chlororaphis]